MPASIYYIKAREERVIVERDAPPYGENALAYVQDLKAGFVEGVCAPPRVERRSKENYYKTRRHYDTATLEKDSAKVRVSLEMLLITKKGEPKATARHSPS